NPAASAFGYDASTPHWRSYGATMPSYGNSLKSVSSDQGMWVYLTQPVTLTQVGTIPLSTKVTLQPGWNLVGLPRRYAVRASKAGLPDAVDKVWIYDQANWAAWERSTNSPDLSLYPGDGLWVHVLGKNPVDWTVVNEPPTPTP